MGIVLSDEQQVIFNTYKNMDKTSNSAGLDLAYANFLKVLKDVNGSTNKTLIFLNRYLNPDWFDSASYDATTLTSFYGVLDDYITTTSQPVRNAKHLVVVAYLKNQTVPNLFLQTPLRTKSFFALTEYTDGGDISATYVSEANASASIGSHSFEPAMMT